MAYSNAGQSLKWCLSGKEQLAGGASRSTACLEFWTMGLLGEELERGN